MVAINTFGSVRAKILGKALGELDQLRAVSECRLTLLECDAQVQVVSVFQPWELSTTACDGRTFHCRRGTDLRPPFDWVGEHLVRRGDYPDAIFYFTDGYGAFPDRPPPYPVLWIMPSHGADTVPFGERLVVV